MVCIVLFVVYQIYFCTSSFQYPLTLSYVSLWLALLLDNFRHDFTTQFNSLSRVDLDARNSVNAPRNIYALVSQKHNDPNWTPLSDRYPNMHSMFELHMSLPLKANEDLMTPVVAVRRSCFGEFFFVWQ